MVDAVTIVSAVASIATALMVIAVLYLVGIEIRSDRDARDVGTAETEASNVEDTEIEGEDA